MTWQPIETAPKDGSVVLVCWASQPDSAALLIWKTNYRIAEPKKQISETGKYHGRVPDQREMDYLANLNESYFGDPAESDDYELAEVGKGPTHWLPLPKQPTNITPPTNTQKSPLITQRL